MASPSGEAFLSLVKRAQKEASLFVILGDLFDLWYGDAKVYQEEYAPILKELKILKKTCRLIYFEGNHDMHLNNFWVHEMGFEVYTGPTQFEFEGIKVWAEHGDEINQEDKPYLALRWFLRSFVMKKIILTAPSELVKAIGTRWSKESRKHSAKKHNNPQLVAMCREYAKQKHAHTPFDLMVTGHTHMQDEFEFESRNKKAKFVNLGSWFDGPKVFVIQNGQSQFISV